MPTRQETFDTVARALVKQGQPALNPGGWCSYRGVGGMRCAVGHLIPDELYSRNMEHVGASDGRVAHVLVDLGHDVALCKALQVAHDLVRRDTHAMWVEAWALSMRGVAELFKLSTSVLDEALAARGAGNQ